MKRLYTLLALLSLVIMVGCKPAETPGTDTTTSTNAPAAETSTNK